MSTRRLKFVSSQGVPLSRRHVIVNPVSSAGKSYMSYSDRYQRSSVTKNVIDSVCSSSLQDSEIQENSKTEDSKTRLVKSNLKKHNSSSRKLKTKPKSVNVVESSASRKSMNKSTSCVNVLNKKDNGNHPLEIKNTEVICRNNVPEFTISSDDISNPIDNISETSVDICRICHGNHMLSSEYGNLISACECRGTIGKMHVKCLERWLTESGKSRCELCSAHYSTIRVHKYGVLKALAMWFFSQNAKQLIVDLVGIILMTPLAILAGWLSGKTLSSMLVQEPDEISWPLASTFTLACMTLVCYYCWIVAAVTRYTMGWWTWYRSQYEVHLKSDDEAVTALTDYS